MAKNNEITYSNRIDIILNQYKKYLERVPMKQDSINQYANQNNYYNKEDDSCRNDVQTFINSLPKWVAKGEEGMTIINYEIEKIEDNYINDKYYRWDNSNHKCYLNRFLKYIKDLSGDTIKKLSKKLSEQMPNQATPLGDDKIEYTIEKLRTKFKGRLRTQDRVSGDKIWLPLRYIAKIYNRAVKFNKLDSNLFSEWLDNVANNIIVHYIDGHKKPENSEEIKSVKLSDLTIKSMLLKKNKDEYNVFIKIQDDEKRVLTPTGRGNEKDLMRVKSIRDIVIDHVIPIDFILKLQEDKLKMLKMVSTSYKNLQELDDPDEESAIGELLIDNNFNLGKLKKELELISEAPLRLMAAEYNSQKSNGLSFKKIIEKDNNFIGVLDENIKYKETHEDISMILYQDLEKNGVTRVEKKTDTAKQSTVFDIDKPKEINFEKITTIIHKI